MCSKHPFSLCVLCILPHYVFQAYFVIIFSKRPFSFCSRCTSSLCVANVFPSSLCVSSIFHYVLQAFFLITLSLFPWKIFGWVTFPPVQTFIPKTGYSMYMEVNRSHSYSTGRKKVPFGQLLPRDATLGTGSREVTFPKTIILSSSFLDSTIADHRFYYNLHLLPLPPSMLYTITSVYNHSSLSDS